MKVLFCSPYLAVSADAPRYTRLRANAMVEAGLDVTVYGFPRTYDPPGGTCAFEYVGLEAMLTPAQRRRWAAWARRLGRYWSFILEPLLIKRAAFAYGRRVGVDIIYVSDVDPWLMLVAMLPYRLLRRRLPAVALVPGNYAYVGHMDGPAWSTRIRNRLNHETARWLSVVMHVVVDNQFVLPAFKFLKKRNVHVVHEGYRPPQTSPNPVEARERLGLPRDQRILLLFGVASRAKGGEVLIAALQAMEPTFFVCIVGSTGGVYEASWGAVEQLQQGPWAKALRVVTQYVPDNVMADYFAACDALVLPYRYGYASTSGNFRQASEYGKAIIASDQFWIGHLVATYDLGLLFPPENVEALRRALVEFGRKDPAWFDAIQKSSGRLLEDLSWTNSGIAYRTLFEQLAK